MAANNYYHNDYSNPTHTSANANAYHDHDLRNEAPLPPLPYSTSPPGSPYVDGSRQPSAAPSSRYNNNDPYDDHNAIPLDDRGRKHGSMHSVAPILPPQHPDDDPFVRDATPGKKRRRRSDGGDGRVVEDEGWFKGKITWVCFLFSVVQLVVFLAEIIKYGKLDTDEWVDNVDDDHDQKTRQANISAQACLRAHRSNSNRRSIP
jgi:hypothetical protein